MDQTLPVLQASIHTVPLDVVQMTAVGCLRVFSLTPYSTSVQVRVLGPIDYNQRGVPRPMIATAQMDAAAVHDLIDWLQIELIRLESHD